MYAHNKGKAASETEPPRKPSRLPHSVAFIPPTPHPPPYQTPHADAATGGV